MASRMRGALAGAVRADEAHDLAGLEVERKVVEREEAERLADAAHLDVLGRFISCPGCGGRGAGAPRVRRR